MRLMMNFSDETDRELLRRFTCVGDEQAFSELVERHLPMVRSVCRRVLMRRHDGDDTSQTVFLTLARKAGSLADRVSLAGWLHRVAWHTSMRARRAELSRARHERRAAEANPGVIIDDPLRRELLEHLDRAMNLLPDLYREPVILHYLEGRTIEECARLLSCKEGTVASRISRGKQMLRERLEQWGLSLSTTAAGSLTVGILCVDNKSAAVLGGTAAVCATPTGGSLWTPALPCAGAGAKVAEVGAAAAGGAFTFLVKTPGVAALLALAMGTSTGAAVLHVAGLLPTSSQPVGLPLQKESKAETEPLASILGSNSGGDSDSSASLPEPSALSVGFAAALCLMRRGRR